MEKYSSWSLLCNVASEVEAHVVQGLLESHGIATRLQFESASRLFGITTGALGGVQIYVPSSQKDSARDVLNAENPTDSIE